MLKFTKIFKLFVLSLVFATFLPRDCKPVLAGLLRGIAPQGLEVCGLGGLKTFSNLMGQASAPGAGDRTIRLNVDALAAAMAIVSGDPVLRESLPPCLQNLTQDQILAMLNSIERIAASHEAYVRHFAGMHADDREALRAMVTSMQAAFIALEGSNRDLTAVIRESYLAADRRDAANREASKERVNLIFDRLGGLLSYCGNGIKDNPQILLYFAAIVIIAVGIPFAFRYFEAQLKKPKLVSETSRGIFGRRKDLDAASLNDVILDPETKSQLEDIIDRLKVAVDGESYYFSMLFHGNPGTGKTMCARAIAKELNIDYLILSAAEWAKIQDLSVAMSEFDKVLRFARASKKGCVIFFDEVNSFARDRDPRFSSSSSTRACDLLNKFLAEVPKSTDDKIIWIFAENIPYLLDDAFRSRVAEYVEFKLPGDPEIQKILGMYVGRFAQNCMVNIDPSFVQNMPAISSKLKGISPRQLEYISEKMVQIAKRMNGVLSFEVADYVAELMLKTIEDNKKFDIQRQQYISGMGGNALGVATAPLVAAAQ